MAASTARRPAAPADRKVATAWIRDLRDGSAVRRHVGTGEVLAHVQPSPDREGRVDVTTYGTVSGRGGGCIQHLEREEAKRFADALLRAHAYRLADVPGGCTIEEG